MVRRARGCADVLLAGERLSLDPPFRGGESSEAEI